MVEHEDLILRAVQGDRQARDRLVSENTGLVWSVARRFLGRGQEAEDLFQIGVIGLLKAIDRFDVTYEVQLSTYAVPLIIGEIRRFLRDDGMLKVSRSVKERARQIYQLKERIEQEQGREPGLNELARELALPTEEVAAAVAACSEVESIDKSVSPEDTGGPLFLEHLDTGESMEEEVVNHMALQQVLEALPERERQIIYRRFFRNENQTQIAKAIGVSQVQVSRILKRTLQNLRTELFE